MIQWHNDLSFRRSSLRRDPSYKYFSSSGKQLSVPNTTTFSSKHNRNAAETIPEYAPTGFRPQTFFGRKAETAFQEVVRPIHRMATKHICGTMPIETAYSMGMIAILSRLRSCRTIRIGSSSGHFDRISDRMFLSLKRES